MSTETHVFFRGKLPTKAALSRTMKELGFPFSIKPASGSLEQQSGFMPMTLRREETGVEFDVFNDRSAVAEFAARGVDPSYERVANFRWSGDFEEAVAGMCAAAALAKLVNGVVFDESEDKLLSVDEAIALANGNLQALAKPEAVRQPGTRPADIKRYLKPLLKQRGDLALVGRLLIIRPVRHLMRGALLDRTSNKYCFQIWRYINPLYGWAGGVGYDKPIHGVVWRVWEPYFQSLLLNSLAEDIFDQVGKLTTLDDFARGLNGAEGCEGARVTALVLAGERERATEIVNDIERSHSDHDYWKDWIKATRTFLERDIASVCAEFHAREARPQPRNLSSETSGSHRRFRRKCSKRNARQSVRSILCRDDALDQPAGHRGCCRNRPRALAKFASPRPRCIATGHVIMLAPLSREAAEAKHRNYQN